AQALYPDVARLRAQARGDKWPQFLVPRDARAIGREALPEIQSSDRAEFLPLLVVADGEYEVAVRGVERFVRHDARMPIAKTDRHAAAGEIVPRLIGEKRSDGVEHREIDLLPASGLLAREQRHAHAVRAEHARHDVGDRDAEPVRRTVGCA